MVSSHTEVVSTANKLKIYLAASFTRKNELREFAKVLRKRGHEVTSRWLRERAHPNTQIQPGDNYRRIAKVDIEDIDRADTFVIFTTNPKHWIKRGGKHFEAGYAFSQGKRMIVVGPPENIFYFLPEMETYKNWKHFEKEVVNA
jgi:nucleoside 2-deoxyribosyltransferase